MFKQGAQIKVPSLLLKVSAIGKIQITNTKQITMTEIQNPKQLAFDLN
jgi:hypothetical protein